MKKADIAAIGDYIINTLSLNTLGTSGASTVAAAVSALNSNSVSMTLNQPSGKITSVSGQAYRQGKIVIIVMSVTLSGSEYSNWLELGNISPAPPSQVKVVVPADINMANSSLLRVVVNPDGKIRAFYGGANSFPVLMAYSI